MHIHYPVHFCRFLLYAFYRAVVSGPAQLIILPSKAKSAINLKCCTKPQDKFKTHENLTDKRSMIECVHTLPHFLLAPLLAFLGKRNACSRHKPYTLCFCIRPDLKMCEFSILATSYLVKHSARCPYYTRDSTKFMWYWAMWYLCQFHMGYPKPNSHYYLVLFVV